MLSVPVAKTSARFLPDPTRVITKPFTPGSERSVDGRSRVERILSRILALSESEVTTTLGTTQAGSPRATSTCGRYSRRTS